MPALRYYYHDGALVSFDIGPRREVTLTIHLDEVWNPNGGTIGVRFGAVANLDEVRAFLSRIPPPASGSAGCIETIMKLEFAGATHGRCTARLELLCAGGISIDCGSVSERAIEA